MKNAGWLFYRQYYQSLSDEQLKTFVKTGKLGKKEDVFFKDESDTMLEFKWDNALNGSFEPGNQQAIQLETTYPGLLVGSGYSHQTGSMGEFKLGFFFDHTTGLPVIPGSSVKGLLRSAFPGKEERDAVQMAKMAFIKERLEDLKPYLGEMDPFRLEDLIFEGKKDDDVYLPMYDHDVFLDAFIVATKDPEKRIFADDFITPHAHPLKNPVPVRFLKIRPEVTFQFNFDLKDSTIGELTLEAADKAKLFENILRIFGIGAKTNVGYGQFKD